MFMRKEVVDLHEHKSHRPSASGPKTRYYMCERCLDVSTFTGESHSVIKFGSYSLMEKGMLHLQRS